MVCCVLAQRLPNCSIHFPARGSWVPLPLLSMRGQLRAAFFSQRGWRKQKLPSSRPAALRAAALDPQNSGLPRQAIQAVIRAVRRGKTRDDLAGSTTTQPPQCERRMVAQPMHDRAQDSLRMQDRRNRARNFFGLRPKARVGEVWSYVSLGCVIGSEALIASVT